MEFTQTKEYRDVISYMTDVLTSEFPARKITVDYLILSILDNTNCHANIIIESLLTQQTIDYLKNYFHTQIVLYNQNQVLAINNNHTIDYRLYELIGMAENEAACINSKNVGTEHILLALLNTSYNFLEAKKLYECGIEYGQIYSIVTNTPNDDYNRNKVETNKNSQNTTNGSYDIPLKSQIDPKVFVYDSSVPNIKRYTINLHDELKKGKNEHLVGRDDILNNIIKVLSRRKKNNVILVGNPGTGKTSIGYRLAEMIDSGNVPDILSEKKVIMLNSMALISGTHLRGMLEERVDGLFRELKNNPNYILFIDDMQNVIRISGKEKDGDLTDMIGGILSEGDIRVVGTISFKNYRNGIESNTTLSTKLQKIIIEPSSVEETFNILKANKDYYENFHHVIFDNEVLKKSINLAKRYITYNNLPDSALDVIDLTGASISLTNKQEKSIKDVKHKLALFDTDKKDAMNSGDFELLDEISKKESVLYKELNDIKRGINGNRESWPRATFDDISDTVSTMTNIPISRLKAGDKETILHIDEILKRDVVGQDEAIDEIAKAIKRAKAGFGDKSKVMATIMCIGSSGVGKTLIVKKLAENIYGSEDMLVRFDMSEYQDKSSVNKLIGASAGYIGYDNGGLLTEAIKNKPYCVLLFDEIEKADESIYNLFLQLFDEGRLTDNNGVTVNFKNVIVIMTSNVGVRKASEIGSGIGFTKNTEQNKRSIIEKSLKSKFNPEFLNRIDKIIHFNSLTDEDIRKIVGIELNKLCSRVKENGINLKYDDSVIEYVYKQAIEQKEYGARPIKRIIQDTISDKLVDFILSSDNEENSYFVRVVNDEIEASPL